MAEHVTLASDGSFFVGRKHYRKSKPMCECSDPGCPCEGKCTHRSTQILYRCDMEDESGVAFCNRCAEDAMDAGVFTTR